MATLSQRIADTVELLTREQKLLLLDFANKICTHQDDTPTVFDQSAEEKDVFNITDLIGDKPEENNKLNKNKEDVEEEDDESDDGSFETEYEDPLDYDVDDEDDGEYEDEDNEVDEDELPFNISNDKSSKKVVFDEDDYDTWTIDNLKKVKARIKELGINPNKVVKGMSDKKMMATYIEIGSSCDTFWENLEKKKTDYLLKQCQKHGIKVSGRKEETKRENAIQALFDLYVESNWG